MELWPWQKRGIEEVTKRLNAGELSLCVQSPTGMGKGVMIERIAEFMLGMGGKCILFTNRRLLTGQTGERFEKAGIQFGYLSAEHGVNTSHPMIIASVQTVTSRVRRDVMALPDTNLMLIDEAHRKDFDAIRQLYRTTHPGVAEVGFTATPANLKGVYSHLIVAGTKREGREYRALVPCRVFAPSEPDMQGVRISPAGEYVQDGMAKRVMQCTVFANVFEQWRRNGGDTRPTILWPPGVPESRWFVEQFAERGVSAAHIDGDTPKDERERIAEGSQNGSIQVVSSFGVLREGVDWPWLSCGILIQVCLDVVTYDQMVGRILRAYEGKTGSILLDFAGAWWRHGSPNEDREWTLGETSKEISAKRKKSSEDGEPEPIRCPQCGGVRSAGVVCPHCGYRHTESVRAVAMEGGQLVSVEGRVRPIKKKTDPREREWLRCLFVSAARGMTFYQARAMYERNTEQALPRELRPQPQGTSGDWDREVAEVYPNFKRGKRDTVRHDRAEVQGSLPNMLEERVQTVPAAVLPEAHGGGAL